MPKITDDELRRRMSEVRRIVEQTGRIPRHAATHVPEPEGRLRAWWDGQMTRLRKGLMPKEVAALFDEVFPAWVANSGIPSTHVVVQPALELPEAIEQLREHLDTVGSYPIWASPIGQWLREQRAKDLAGELSDAERRALDEAAPDWREPGYRKSASGFKEWTERTAELESFVAEHGRLPRASRRADASERALSVWLRRSVKDPLDPVSKADLDRVAPQWVELSEQIGAGIDMAFMDFVNELAEFVKEHDALPESGADTEPFERSLSRELASNRAKRRDLLLDDREIDLLEAVLAGRDVPEAAVRETIKSFKLRVQQVQALYAQAQTWPRTTSNDVREAEAARFILDQQEHFRAGTIGEKRLAVLNEHLPGWLVVQLAPVEAAGTVTARDEVDVALDVINETYPHLATKDGQLFARTVANLLLKGRIDRLKQSLVQDVATDDEAQSTETDAAAEEASSA